MQTEANHTYGGRPDADYHGIFRMKDCKIRSEIAYELWREAGSAVAVDFVPEGSHVQVSGA